MRFCPFCSAENADELAVCQACGRRLPPLPPRRARNAPPTGVMLPMRPQTIAPRPDPTMEVRDSAVEIADPNRSLLNALTPGPAAQRREAPPPEPRDDGRRATDSRGAEPITATRGKPISVPPAIPPTGPRATTTSPPPIPGTGPRAAPSTLPPPLVSTSAPMPPMPPRAQSVPPSVHTTALGMPAAPVLPPVEIAAQRPRASTAEPPPTRIQRGEAQADRPFTPPTVSPIPEIPEPGLYGAARYAVRFARARWQRRGAIKTLGAEIKQDTDALDQVLGALGRVARNAHVDGRVFSAENAAISAAEERGAALGREHNEVDARKLDENSKFVDVERERNTKLAEAERLVDEAQRELGHLEAQRRALRDKRKELERRQKAYLKAAEDADRQSSNAQMGDQRSDLRRSAEQHRREAAALEPDRQEIDRRLASLERPIGEATAKLDAAKAELDAAKRSLADAREGHTHRLAELDAEQKRKSREIAQSESEILRRLVTLGTLVNLNRIEDPQFDELYQRIDRLRGAITARTTEIEKLTAEREAYDRGALTRGVAVIGGAIVALIALIVILRAIF